ncbi:MAG: DUF1361 domain-containing protein [Bacteroidetes bacterium]|nr:DUF1361 domain-containing protein [Bacteroidota bacterium]
MQFYHKYKWMAPSFYFFITLLAARIIFTGHITFAFLPWNLFLAVLPLYFAHKLHQTEGRWKQWMYAGLWLLFFPNAMYIVTDLFHLMSRPDMPLWFDLLLLLSAGINGIVLGYLSLGLIENWLSYTINPKYLKSVIFALMLLCGYGIYLGRYDRWNSWDVVADPFGLFSDISYDVVHPFRNWDVWMLTVLFGTWMYLLYGYIKRLKTAG